MPVARCPKTRDQQCNFFLTADDDATARVEKSSDIPPAPRTPTGRQMGGMPQALPTPDTGMGIGAGSGAGSGLFGASFSRRAYFQRPNESPTPHRFRADEGGDLASLILGLLQKDGIALRISTESAIRYHIGDQVAAYEAKLQNSAETINMLYGKLDEMEKGNQLPNN